MKRDPKKIKKTLTVSSEKIRELKTLPDHQLPAVVGGWCGPCGVSYRG